MTKDVGTELVGGDREVVQGRVRKDPKERERCGRLGGAVPPVEGGSGNGAVPPLGMPRFERSAEPHRRGLGARVVPRGSVTRQKLSFDSREIAS